jgi:undecaprenyl-diphosphatase
VSIYHIILLAVVQGATEFLPISSSGHLILASRVLELPDQGLAIDVAVHVGTLFAVIVYFWRDIFHLGIGTVRLLSGRRDPRTLLVARLVIATLPVIGAGYMVSRYFPNGFRSIEIIAWSTIGFAIVLLIADRLGMTVRRVKHLSKSNALFIGLLQVLALIPGTSRAGITMTAGRMIGMERTEAARFSMLLSIPTIVGAGVLSGTALIQTSDTALGLSALIAASLSFVTGVIAIAIMMRWLKKSSFTPFVIYRVALGGGLLAWIYL